MANRKPKPGDIRVKRVYEAPEPSDGTRILVDRLWPRGLTKETAHVDLWLRDLAPSAEWRKRLHADFSLWPAFQKAYPKELQTPEAQAAVAKLREQAAAGPITLLFAAKDEERNNAVALRAILLGG